MDLERELTRVLRSKDLALPVADPVSDVHDGMRRRRRTQQVLVLAAGLGVVVVALGATLLVDNPLSSKPLPPASHGPTPAQPSDLQAVPEGFTASDLSFVSTQDGWAIGTAPCGTARCTIELVTSDAGTTWNRRPAVGLPRTCTANDCVRKVRFADARVGYAFAPSLFVTTDAGATWSQVRSGPIYGLEIADGTASRVVATQQDCAPSCRFVVQTSAVGSLTWNTVFIADDFRVDAMMTRHGSRIGVALFAHTSGGAGDAHAALVLSTDDGATFTRRDDPCGPASNNSPAERDTTTLSFGPEGQLVAVCTYRMAMPAGPVTAITISTDSGRTFGPLRAVPAPAAAIEVAMVSTDRVVVEDATGLMLTQDGGQTWRDVAQAGQPGGTAGAYLAFSTARTGTWVGQDGATLWRTSDGGATWTEHTFRES